MKLVLFVRINSYSFKLHDLTKQNQNEMFENIVSKMNDLLPNRKQECQKNENVVRRHLRAKK